MQEHALTPFEAYCPHCRVTSPVEQRRCLHCGGRLDKERGAMARPRRGPDVEIEDGAEPVRRGFSPVSLIWVVLLLAGYLYRSCTTG